MKYAIVLIALLSVTTASAQTYTTRCTTTTVNGVTNTVCTTTYTPPPHPCRYTPGVMCSS